MTIRRFQLTDPEGDIMFTYYARSEKGFAVSTRDEALVFRKSENGVLLRCVYSHPTLGKPCDAVIGKNILANSVVEIQDFTEEEMAIENGDYMDALEDEDF